MPTTDRRNPDPLKKANAQALAQLREDTWVADLQRLMGDAGGRRFMFRLLEEAGVYQSSLTGEALSTAAKEGYRNFGLFLMREVLQHSSKRLIEMQRENLKYEHLQPQGNGQAHPGQPAGAPAAPA